MNTTPTAAEIEAAFDAEVDQGHDDLLHAIVERLGSAPDDDNLVRLRVEILQSERANALAAEATATAAEPDPGWLTGEGMDPLGATVEPLPALAGFPYLHAGVGAMIVGPTGGGRSALVQAGAYVASLAGLRVAYLGSEISLPEFHARARDLAGRRGEDLTDELRDALARVRYLDLASVMVQAQKNPAAWVAGIVEAYDIVIVDPIAAAASALDLDFDASNREFVSWYDRLIQPLVTAGVTVPLVDNVGHATDARKRAKGVSAKSDKADLTFACRLQQTGRRGLIIEARKVRSVRAHIHHGERWLFVEQSRSIEHLGHDERQGDNFRPTALMERVSKYLEAIPVTHKAPISDEVRASVTGRNVYIDRALKCLVADGYVEPIEDGQATRHHSVRPYRDEASGTTGRGRDEVAETTDGEEPTARGPRPL